MHPVKLPGIREFRQVAPDRLRGDVEAFGQIIDDDAPLAARDVQDFGLTHVQGHGVLPQADSWQKHRMTCANDQECAQ